MSETTHTHKNLDPDYLEACRVACLGCVPEMIEKLLETPNQDNVTRLIQAVILSYKLTQVEKAADKLISYMLVSGPDVPEKKE